MTASSFPILAIDLGKYKSVACWDDPAAGATGRFESFTTSRLNVQRVLGNKRPTVVIEA